ncbi:MAG: adenylate/guanylate cyclase domain-containing protein [Chloroflexota bacterium]
MPPKDPSRAVENRLSDSPASRFWRELFSNSGQFPIAIILWEILSEHWEYLLKPDMYILAPSAIFQAYFLSRRLDLPGWQKFLGNLIAPALYTAGEMFFEGMEFFAAPHHLAFWVFAILIGALQAAQTRRVGWFAESLLIVENVLRAQILFVLYAAFETIANPAQTVSLSEFFKDTSHQFIALATFLLGISVGLANANAGRYLGLLRQTASQLRVYSEWLLGRDLLGRAFGAPEALQLSRQRRTILFMDIRGFTPWSEKHSPEEMANLLNQYYAIAESVFARHRVVKFKFTADEIMAVFLDPDDAVTGALTLRQRARDFLQLHGLDAGLGLHTGLLVEGLLGSPQLKFYDVIGDTVNTANRIERIAGPGEVWISEDLRANLAVWRPLGGAQEISLKGKERQIKVYQIQL